MLTIYPLKIRTFVLLLSLKNNIIILFILLGMHIISPNMDGCWIKLRALLRRKAHYINSFFKDCGSGKWSSINKHSGSISKHSSSISVTLVSFGFECSEMRPISGSINERTPCWKMGHPTDLTLPKCLPTRSLIRCFDFPEI